MKIAVIGSRETPKVYNKLLFGLCHFLELKHTLRSGFCPIGPDAVVTRVLYDKLTDWVNKEGDKPKIEIYPPKIVECSIKEFMFFPPEEQRELRCSIVDKLHPNPGALKDWMYNLHNRNLSIINGIDLNDPVDLVIYGHPKPIVSGGTKLGVDYAKSLDIPTYNVVYDDLSKILSIIS